MENILKCMWRIGARQEVSFKELKGIQGSSSLNLSLALFNLRCQGWITKKNGRYLLTKDGEARAARIIRLHRLWEVYLADYLGLGSEKVHKNAEEMEHIITPELERQLTYLLDDPKQDPHQQPIPPMDTLT